VSDAILVGPVTTRRGYRLHLAASGRAHCGAGRGLILGPGEPLQVKHQDTLCRRCIGSIRAAVEDAARTNAAADGGRWSETAEQDLAALADALMTPAQRLERARRHVAMVAEIRARLRGNGSLVDRMAATVQFAPVVQARAENARRRTWADLRDEFATTHPVLAA
jgi:hypothetical protein